MKITKRDLWIIGMSVVGGFVAALIVRAAIAVAGL